MPKTIRSTALLVASAAASCADHDASGSHRVRTTGSVRADVIPNVSTASPWHVFEPGHAFSVNVSVPSDAASGVVVMCRWVDARGATIGTPVRVTGTSRAISAPCGDAGYYGIQFFSTDPGVAFPPQPRGFPSRIYGFGVIPVSLNSDDLPRLDPDSPFGVIQAHLDDPYLRLGSGPAPTGIHVKTLTWERNAATWSTRISHRWNGGHTELPLVLNAPWSTDDNVAVPTAQLDQIASKIENLISAEPEVLEWQLGLEENAGNPYAKAFYFANLARKAQRVRAVADRYNPNIEFVYNTRGFDTNEFDLLLSSSVFDRLFDVLAQNPYMWPAFPTPETWLAAHVRDLRSRMDANGQQSKPIWIGELGIPVRGTNDPSGFFGYPSSNTRVPGATPHYAAMFLVKAHVIAWSAGVERIYMYNYQNRGDDVGFAEHHFGLRAYAPASRVGHPLPAYVAYVVMLQNLKGSTPVAERRPHPDHYVFEFKIRGSSERRIVTWLHPASSRSVPLADLAPGLSPNDVRWISDLYGTPQPLVGASITIGEAPVFLHLR